MNARFLIGIICLFVSGVASATAVQTLEVFKECDRRATCPDTGEIFQVRVTATYNADPTIDIIYNVTKNIAMGSSQTWTSLQYFSTLNYTIQELVPAGWEMTGTTRLQGLDLVGNACAGLPAPAGTWCGATVTFKNGTTPAQFVIRNSPVPVPAAVWLFGSGLLGLVGMAGRKKA